MRINKWIHVLGIILIGQVALFCQAETIQVRESAYTTPITFQSYLFAVGQNNLSLLAEKYQIQIADAAIAAAKVMPDPELTFETTHDTYTLALGYTLELGNKRGARVRLARSEAEHTQLMLEYFFQELRAESTDAYLDAILQQALLDVKQSSYLYMLQLSQSDSIRFSKGEINENDARQSMLEATTLLNEVFDQEAAYQSALAVLNQYMGKGLDTLFIPEVSRTNRSLDYTLGELIAIASENRTDLLAALKGNEVAINQLKQAKAERRMDINLSLGYERDWHGLFPNRNSLKTEIAIPLKFSNVNKGSVRMAKLAIEQSEYKAKNVHLQVQTEVSQAFYQYEAVKKQLRQYESGLLENSKKVLDGMVYKYKRGETSILDVLIAQRTYNEVQEQYLHTVKGYASAWVHVERVCGIWDIDF